MKVLPVLTRPHADGKSGDDLKSMQHFWRLIVKQHSPTQLK